MQRSNGQVKLTYRWLRARYRGGGLYSDQVTTRLGSLLAVAIGPGVHPSLVTLANFVVGTAAGLLGILAVGARPAWLIGMAVLVGWQLAYALDCADGQIARATGKATPAGRRADFLCDFAVQSLVTAAVAAGVAQERRVHVAWVAIFASTWMLSIVVFLLCDDSDDGSHSLLPRTGRAVTGLKVSRDYGFQIFLFGLAFTFWRPGLYWLMLGVTALNTSFLVASIANEVGLSIGKSVLRGSPRPELSGSQEPSTGTEQSSPAVTPTLHRDD